VFNDLVVTALAVYLVCSALGGLDDLLKIIRRNSSGLSSWQKLFLQGLVTWFALRFAANNPPVYGLLVDVHWHWFRRLFEPDMALAALGIFYFFVVAGTTNAVNITDGIDGLAITNIMPCLAFFMVLAVCSCDAFAIPGTFLTYIAGAGELAVLCACFIGGCLAFCVFNLSPASIFMGDLGSIGLGGLLAILACMLRVPFILLIVGMNFVIETLSVAAQLTSKRLFKKKIFLMAPIHHHFELKGYTERQIVKVAIALQCIHLLVAFGIIFHGYLRNG
jgi:phospho-N-acetylmuramoyl-pentapeptide-transferase